MSNSKSKDLRKALKNVIQSDFESILSEEMQLKIMGQVNPLVMGVLDEVRKHLDKAVEDQQSDNRAMLEQIANTVTNHLNDMNTTMLAWQELMQEILASDTLIGDTFRQELVDKKKEVAEQISASSKAE